jgi:hypothetical protein
LFSGKWPFKILNNFDSITCPSLCAGMRILISAEKFVPDDSFSFLNFDSTARKMGKMI